MLQGQLLLAGVACVLVSGQPPRQSLLSRKDAAWLALAARLDNAASPQVAALVWPEADAHGALNNLRQRVYRLRKATGLRLVEMDTHIRLAADLLPADADPRAALQANPDAPMAEPLAGLAYDAESELASWVAQWRAAHTRAVQQALADLSVQAEQQGQLVQALHHAQRLHTVDRLSEHALRRVMRLHYLRGDAAAAVVAFEAAEALLRDELGLKPSAETQALLRMVEQAHGASPSTTTTHPPQAIPASLLRPPRLVGRDADLDRLAQAEQQGQIALVTGEAGMGKTRLLQTHLAGRAGAVHVQARPGDAAVPYALVGRLLHALADHTAPGACMPALPATARSAAAVEGGIAAKVPPAPTAPTAPTTTATTGAELQTAVQRLVAAAMARGLRVLAADDMHFADCASADMLLALMHDTALDGLRWIVAHRPAEGSGSEMLAAFAESPQAHRIVLQPLGMPDVQALLVSLDLSGAAPAALAPALVRHTGGNPLFVLETLRAAVLQGQTGSVVLPRPMGLAHLLEQRLHRLSRPAMALARVAAVAVPDFSVELAESVLGVSAFALADAWQELEDAQVLRGAAFAHDLVHDAVQRLSPPAIAGHAHRQIAAFLAAHGAEPARVARHWADGGMWAEAAAAFQAAAERALRAARHREQMELLDCAAHAWHHAGDALAALRVQGDAIDACLRSEGVAAGLARADALIAAAATPLAGASGWVQRANALLYGGRFAEADPAARQALQLAPADAADLRFLATTLLATSLSQRGAARDALGLMEPLAEHADNHAPPARRMVYWGTMANLLSQADRMLAAASAGQHHLALAESLDNGAETVSALMSLSTVQLRLGDPDTAVVTALRIESMGCADDDSALMRTWNSCNIAFMRVAQGAFDDALSRLSQVQQVFHGSSPQSRLLWLCEHALALTWLRLGQPARAHQLVQPQPTEPDGLPLVRRLLLRAAVQHAMGHGAADLLAQAAALCSDQGAIDLRLGVALESLQLLPPVEGDADRCAALQQQASDGGCPVLAALAAGLRCHRLAHEGRLHELAHVADEAERLALQHRSHQAYLPQLMAYCHAAHLRIGHAEAAARCAAAALHWVHHVALPQVPPPFVDSFLRRNKVNARAIAYGRTRSDKE